LDGTHALSRGEISISIAAQLISGGKIMADALLFHNSNSLEFEDVRQQVLRIPEVLTEVRRAQSIWDATDNPITDFMNYLNSDDAAFFQSGSMKEMVLGIVQLGLFRRHVTKHGLPKFIVGDTKNVSPAMVAAGHISLEEMLLGSRAAVSTTLGDDGGLPSLRGQWLPQYQIFKAPEAGEVYEVLPLAEMMPSRCLRALAETYQVEKVIAVGPGAYEIPESERSGLLSDLRCHESIDMDPLLSWFWPRVRELNEIA
jgi:hypothetical protein